MFILYCKLFNISMENLNSVITSIGPYYCALLKYLERESLLKVFCGLRSFFVSPVLSNGFWQNMISDLKKLNQCVQSTSEESCERLPEKYWMMHPLVSSLKRVNDGREENRFSFLAATRVNTTMCLQCICFKKKNDNGTREPPHTLS